MKPSFSLCVYCGSRLRRSLSIARRLAVTVSQAAGTPGTPSRGQVASATA